MDPIAMLQQKLEETVNFGTRALDAPAIMDVEVLDQKIRTIDSLARETFQETLRDVYDVIANKLDRGETLGKTERDALELLFTGEAKYYLKTENNYHDWIAELRRLLSELQKTGREGIDQISDLMHVQALCRDASHVLPELQYYLREQERVERFRENLSGDISREGGRLLARMIRDLMTSPHR